MLIIIGYIHKIHTFYDEIFNPGNDKLYINESKLHVENISLHFHELVELSFVQYILFFEFHFIQRFLSRKK